MSSSSGRQIHSRRRLRLPCIGVKTLSSSSVVLRPLILSLIEGFLRLFAVLSESEASDNASTACLGIISSRSSRNSTLLTGGNIRRDALADVADG